MLPIFLGITFNHFQLKAMHYIKQYLPSISVIMISLAIACIFSLTQSKIIQFPLHAILAAVYLNMMGYILGAIIAYIMKFDIKSILSVSFEFGIFDAALALLICISFFNPETAVIAALLSIIQNLTGAIIVKFANLSAGLQIPHTT